jgi:hypothetical protein
MSDDLAALVADLDRLLAAWDHELAHRYPGDRPAGSQRDGLLWKDLDQGLLWAIRPS